MNASLFASNKSRIINWHISRLVAWYTFRDISRSFGTYVLLSLGWIGVYLSIGNTLKVIQQGYATVIREPLSLIVLGMLIVSSLFFSIIAGISVVRDREQGVVELLFYGPISHSEYVIGKFLAHWTFYAILAFIFLIGTGMMAWLVKLPISLYLVWLYWILVGAISSYDSCWSIACCFNTVYPGNRLCFFSGNGCFSHYSIR